MISDYNSPYRSVAGRVAMVTGAASGIGKATAALLAQAGARVVVADVNAEAGVKALVGNAAYGSSKAAVRFLTRIAALEGAPHRIRVNSISPAAVATPMWEGTGCWPVLVAEKDGREAALRALVSERGFAQPEDIARAVQFLVSDEARFVTGVDLPVDSGFSAA